MAGADRAAQLRSEPLTGEHDACHGQPFPGERDMTAWFVPPVVAPLSARIMVAIGLVVRSFA